MSSGGSTTRVLLVAAAGSTTGGGERHVADLLTELPKCEVEVSVVCPAGSDLSRLAEDVRADVFPIDLGHGMSPRQLVLLRSTFRKWAPHVVHAHGTRAALFARLVDPRARDRVVYTVHGFHVDKAGGSARRRVLVAVERGLRCRTALWIAVSEATRQELLAAGGADAARVVVVHNGVRVEARPPGEARGPSVVLQVARYSPQKDHETLLRAWALVIASRPHWTLHLVGGGGESVVRALVDELGLADHVVFGAPRSDVDALYRDADVFALATKWEGLPYVVLEAMAAGLPVVASDVGGIGEAVIDRTTGLLVPSGNPLALAEALGTLIDDPDRRRSFGERGQARIQERFSLETMVQQTRDAYARIVGAGPGYRGNLSWITVNHGANDKVLALLNDLASSPAGPDEVVIVDNGPEPLTDDDLPALPFSARVLHVENRGYGAAVNAGVAATIHPVFCVSNPDMRLPDPAGIRHLAGQLRGNVGMVIPRFVRPDGTRERSVSPRPPSILDSVLRLPGRFAPKRLESEFVKNAACALFVMERAFFDELGGFDEGFFMYFEDTDLSMRVHQAGRRAFRDATVEVIHEVGGTAAGAARRHEWYRSSQLRYFEKWRPRWELRVVRVVQSVERVCRRRSTAAAADD